MIVQDVLLLPSFDASHIIAGKNGLENEVTSAMVLEATDIENWGKRGQLIISSFYALEHLSEHEIARFFTKMGLIGIAAIAFKPERLVAEAPQQVSTSATILIFPLSSCGQA